jgi:hypothetical protein
VNGQRWAIAIAAGLGWALTTGGPAIADPSLSTLACDATVLVSLTSEDGATVPNDAASWAAGVVTATGRKVAVNPPDSGDRVPFLFIVVWRPVTGDPVPGVSADRDVSLNAFRPSTGSVDQVARADLVEGDGATSEDDQRARVASWWQTAMPGCPGRAIPAPSSTSTPAAGGSDDGQLWVSPDDGHPLGAVPDLVAVDPGQPAVDSGRAVGPGGVVLEERSTAEYSARPWWVPAPLWGAYGYPAAVAAGVGWAPDGWQGWPGLGLTLLACLGVANVRRAGRQERVDQGEESR